MQSDVASSWSAANGCRNAETQQLVTDRLSVEPRHFRQLNAQKGMVPFNHRHPTHTVRRIPGDLRSTGPRISLGLATTTVRYARRKERGFASQGCLVTSTLILCIYASVAYLCTILPNETESDSSPSSSSPSFHGSKAFRLHKCLIVGRPWGQFHGLSMVPMF